MLEETAERLTVKLEYDDLRKGEVNTPGGTFVLKGKRHILVHKHLTLKEKIEVLTDILGDLDDIEGVHLPPEVRRKLEAAKGGEGQ